MKILFYNTKARDTRSPIMQTSDKRKGFEEPSVLTGPLLITILIVLTRLPCINIALIIIIRTMLLSWKQVLTICNGTEIHSM